MNTKRLLPAVSLLLLSAVLLSTASFAWFSMNTSVAAKNFQIEAYSDSLFLEISEEKNGTYAAEADFAHNGKRLLRLVTLGHISEGGMIIKATEISDGSRYASDIAAATGAKYYQKVMTDPERNDTYEGDNFISINAKLRDASSVAGCYNFDKGEITFNMVTSSDLKFDGTGSYYKKIGNTYYKLSLDTDGVPEDDELESGASLRGMFTVDLGNIENKSARYDGSSLYYKIDPLTGDISPVGSLALGSVLDGYYTVEELSSGISFADGTSKYYLKNERDDYVCLGTPAAGTNLRDYYYWARAYSSSMEEVQSENTLNVLKEQGIDNYYLHDSMYLRLSSNEKNGENLRINSVNVVGNDSLTPAIRILFAAKNGEGERSYATYNNRTGEIKHLNGDVLFDLILGESKEIIEVEVYIYFEGTDDAAKSESVRLSGQSVSIEFSIDRLTYAP